MHTLRVCFALCIGCSGKVTLKNRLIGAYFPIFMLRSLWYKQCKYIADYLPGSVYLWGLVLFFSLFILWRTNLFAKFCTFFAMFSSLIYFAWTIVEVFTSPSYKFFPLFIDYVVSLCYFAIFMFCPEKNGLTLLSSLGEFHFFFATLKSNFIYLSLFLHRFFSLDSFNFKSKFSSTISPSIHSFHFISEK